MPVTWSVEGGSSGTALLGKQGFEAIPEEHKRMLDENQTVEIAQLLGAAASHRFVQPISAASIPPRCLLPGDEVQPYSALISSESLSAFCRTPSD